MSRMAHKAPRGGRSAVGTRAAVIGNRRDLSPSRVHLSFLRSLRSEMLKLTSLASTWIMTLIALVLQPFGALTSAWSLRYMSTIDQSSGKPLKTPAPIAMSEYWVAAGSGLALASVVVGIMGVLCISAEFSSSSIDATLTSNPRRGTVLAAKAVCLAVLTWVTSQIGVLLAWASVQIILSAPGRIPLKASEASIPWVNLLGGPIFMAVFAVMALGIGAMCRSTVGGVMTVLGLVLIAPMLFGIIQAVSRYFVWVQSLSNILPLNLLDYFLSGQTEPVPGQVGFVPLWWQAGLIMVAWTAVFYALGTLVMKRIDID